MTGNINRGINTAYLWVNTKEIPIETKEINEYIVNWAKAASNSKYSVIIKIDENRDGNYKNQIST